MNQSATTSRSDTEGSTRRGFLLSAGAGAAGAAALGTLRHGSASTPVAVPANVDSPLVAFVRDARSGEVVVMVDDREYIVRDHDLAARIARAAH